MVITRRTDIRYSRVSRHITCSYMNYKIDRLSQHVWWPLLIRSSKNDQVKMHEFFIWPIYKQNFANVWKTCKICRYRKKSRSHGTHCLTEHIGMRIGRVGIECLPIARPVRLTSRLYSVLLGACLICSPTQLFFPFYISGEVLFDCFEYVGGVCGTIVGGFGEAWGVK